MELILLAPGERQGEQLVNLWATIGVPRGGWCCFLGGTMSLGVSGCPQELSGQEHNSAKGCLSTPAVFQVLPGFFFVVYELAVSSDGTNCLRNLSLQPGLICPVNPVLAFLRSYLAPLIYRMAGILRTSNY